MDGKSDYESLQKTIYEFCYSSVSKKIMESIFRSAKPIEFSSGKADGTVFGSRMERTVPTGSVG